MTALLARQKKNSHTFCSPLFSRSGLCPPEETRSDVVMAMILQRLTGNAGLYFFISFPHSYPFFFRKEYCKIIGLSARVHVGSGAPFASVVLMLQSHKVHILSAALDLVSELCLYEDFWAALDSSDVTTVIRLVDHADSNIRGAALNFLLMLLAPAVKMGTEEARQKLRALCVANQLRPRLVALLKRELVPELQQTAGEVLTRLVLGSGSVEATAASLLASEPPKTPTKTLSAKEANTRKIESPTRKKSFTPMFISDRRSPVAVMPSSDLVVEDGSSLCEDFVALLSHVGPIALRGAHVLSEVVARGGATVAQDLLEQRGVEKLVVLLFDLLETQRASTDWSVRTRKYALKTLVAALSCHVGCVECFVDCGGIELCALYLASAERLEQDGAASCLLLCTTEVSRCRSYVCESILGIQEDSQGFPSFSVQMEASKGKPNPASRAIFGSSAAQGGVQSFCNLKEAARLLHAHCYWAKKSCPTAEVLREEVQECMDDHARLALADTRLAHEQKLLNLDLEYEKEVGGGDLLFSFFHSFFALSFFFCISKNMGHLRHKNRHNPVLFSLCLHFA